MSKYTQEQIKNLVEGNLDWNTVLKMLSMPKDHERFQMYLKVLQDKVDFDDKIVLPLWGRICLWCKILKRSGLLSVHAVMRFALQRRIGNCMQTSMCAIQQKKWKRCILNS